MCRQAAREGLRGRTRRGLRTLSREFVHLPCKQSSACGLQERLPRVKLTVDLPHTNCPRIHLLSHGTHFRPEHFPRFQDPLAFSPGVHFGSGVTPKQYSPSPPSPPLLTVGRSAF